MSLERPIMHYECPTNVWSGSGWDVGRWWEAWRCALTCSAMASKQASGKSTHGRLYGS